ncbi:MAG TPA: glutathione S-transferase family protein [Tahibacter sp.]|nr:glutathione S-transferase family protein [Tahibacter sp.]
MVTVYGMKSSGNCYKVQLLLEQIGRPYTWREVNILAGESRTPQYLAMNANGRVPLLEDAGRYLAESNAILTYLADGTPLMPDDRWTRAQVMQWLFFEQYSHEPYVAVARFIRTMLPADTPRLAELPRLVERGNQALAVMERHLSAQSFFVGDTYTIADIALYAYTHAAADGGFDLAAFPAVGAWLGRVRAQPGHVAMASPP